jgi:uncharacterized protein YjbJ (UPF0337 family)
MCAAAQKTSFQIPNISLRVRTWLTRAAIHFNSYQGKTVMNKNQAQGFAKNIVGKVQEEAGKLVGNKEQEAKGLQKQVSGKAEKHLGDIKEVVKDAREAFKDAASKP